jgi:hypothetical protein
MRGIDLELELPGIMLWVMRVRQPGDAQVIDRTG